MNLSKLFWVLTFVAAIFTNCTDRGLSQPDPADPPFMENENPDIISCQNFLGSKSGLVKVDAFNATFACGRKLFKISHQGIEHRFNLSIDPSTTNLRDNDLYVNSLAIHVNSRGDLYAKYTNSRDEAIVGASFQTLAYHNPWQSNLDSLTNFSAYFTNLQTGFPLDRVLLSTQMIADSNDENTIKNYVLSFTNFNSLNNENELLKGYAFYLLSDLSVYSDFKARTNPKNPAWTSLLEQSDSQTKAYRLLLNQEEFYLLQASLHLGNDEFLVRRESSKISFAFSDYYRERQDQFQISRLLAPKIVQSINSNELKFIIFDQNSKILIVNLAIDELSNLDPEYRVQKVELDLATLEIPVVVNGEAFIASHYDSISNQIYLLTNNRKIVSIDLNSNAEVINNGSARVLDGTFPAIDEVNPSLVVIDNGIDLVPMTVSPLENGDYQIQRLEE